MMPIEIKMPALSPTMEKGTIAKWLVKNGDAVRPGDVLAEIETDKATMELEAEETGTVATIMIAEGAEDVIVGTVIAVMAVEGEEAPSAEVASGDQSPALRSEEALPPQAVLPPSVRKLVGAHGINVEDVTGTGKGGRLTKADVLAVLEVAPSLDEPSPMRDVADELHVAATPLARRVAAAKGLSLADLRGSGPQGKIVIADLGLPAPVTAAPSVAAATAAVPAAATPAASFAPPAGVPAESVKLSGMRKTIARRLTESKQTVPHFYLTARCCLDPLLRLRTELNRSLEGREVKLSVNDILMKAMALAMVEVPDVNIQFGGEELHRFSRVDIAMAVAIPGGLVTPVVRDVGNLSLSAIANESKALVTRARDGKLAPEDYQGGTASISNLGMYGIDEMVPVINPPQAMILGIGAGVEQPWKVEGQIGLATIMAATASFDHRAIDGATAAEFMKAFRELVEQPLRIAA